MNTLTLADLRPQQTGSGNSLMAVNQQLAISMGVVSGALILKNWTFLMPASVNLHPAFRMTLLSIGGITLASSLVFKRLHVSDGANLTRGTRP